MGTLLTRIMISQASVENTTARGHQHENQASTDTNHKMGKDKDTCKRKRSPNQKHQKEENIKHKAQEKQKGLTGKNEKKEENDQRYKNNCDKEHANRKEAKKPPKQSNDNLIIETTPQTPERNTDTTQPQPATQTQTQQPDDKASSAEAETMVKEWSARDIKTLCQSHKLDISGCFEKSELIGTYYSFLRSF